jgi:methylphosphotriester-DNA--protein-cysteine methyltransferase
MNRIVLLPGALVFIGVARLALAGDDPASSYREARTAVQEALKLELAAEKMTLEAVHKCEMALFTLGEIKALYPEWRAEEVEGTAEECQRAIAALKSASLTKRGAVFPAAPAEGGAFMGSRRSGKAHRADCIYGRQIPDRNRVSFTTYEEAAAAGYIPCKVCRPDRATALRPSPESNPTPSRAADSVDAALPCLASASSTGECCASSAAEVFHRPACEWARKISPQNLLRYKTRDKASAAGKKPCRICNP